MTEVFRRRARDDTVWYPLGHGQPVRLHNTLPLLIGDELIVTSGDRCRRWSNGEWQERGLIPNPTDLIFLILVPRDPLTFFGLSYWNNRAWTSEDTGWTWTQPVTDLPYDGQAFSVTALAYDEPQQWLWAISGVGTCYLDVAELNATGPLRFRPAAEISLAVYPNPFNTQAVIRFDRERPSPVEVCLYDVTGRLVQTLAHELQNAGRHEITLDGGSLASEIYVVSLKTDAAERSQKVVLLK